MKMKNCLYIVFVILLSGCGMVPDLGGWAMQKPKPDPVIYKPIDAEVKTLTPATNGLHIICRAGHGQARFGATWAPFADVEFTMIERGRTNVNITSTAGAVTQMQAIFDHEGQRMVFCPLQSAGTGAVSCASLYALDNDFVDGFRRTLDIPGFIKGGLMTCADQQNRLKAL